MSEKVPFYLEDCSGAPFEKPRWYCPSHNDNPNGILPAGKYICGAPELFLSSKTLKNINSVVPKRKVGHHAFSDGMYIYRAKPGTEIYIRDGKTDKEVTTKAASGLIVIVPQDDITPGRYANAIRFELSEESKVYLKTRSNDFAVTVMTPGEPTESLYFSS